MFKGFVESFLPCFVRSCLGVLSSAATVRAAVGVTGGLALALAMMQAGREAAPRAVRECRRTTCAARCANMSAFGIARSSFLSWARTAARSQWPVTMFRIGRPGRPRGPPPPLPVREGAV
jgi:hypothetical protein